MTREHANNERQKLIQIREENLRANEDLLGLQKEANSPMGPPTAVANCNLLLQRLEELFREIVAQSELVRETETRLGALEYHRNQEERKLYDQAFSSDEATIFDIEILALDPIEVPSFDETDDESERLPSLLAEYYNSAATMNNYLERIQELEEEHEEELNQREEAREQGQPLMPPERVFETNYLNQRTEMIHIYVTAKQESHQLAKRCIEAGYHVEVDSEEYDAGLDHSRRVKGDHFLNKDAAPTDADRRPYSGVSPIERMILGSATPQERVVTWLRDTLRLMSSQNKAFEQGARAMSEGIPEPFESPQPAETLDSATQVGRSSAPYTSVSVRLSRIDEGPLSPNIKRESISFFPEMNMGKPHSEPDIH
jgi:hypothetical protein